MRSDLEEEENVRATEAVAALCQVRGLHVGPAKTPWDPRVCGNLTSPWAQDPKGLE